LFKRPDVEAFGKSLALDISKRYPPELDRQPEKRPSVNRLTRIVEDVCVKAVTFRDERGLGWFGKAKLCNTLRWELNALGYGKDFVELTTEAVMVQISRRGGTAGSTGV
jgi:hypothetical protein